MLAASQHYDSSKAPPTATTDNSVRASTTRPAPTTTAAVPLHRSFVMRMLPNRSHRLWQRDPLKKYSAFAPMKLRDFKLPGSKYRFDAEQRELRDLVSQMPWAVRVPSAARALLPGPRGSLNRVVPKATNLTILDCSAGTSHS